MDIATPALDEVRKRRNRPPIRGAATIAFAIIVLIVAFFLPESILFYLVALAVLIWLECRPNRHASLWEKPLIRGMRDVAIAITVIVSVRSLELPDSISFYAAIAVAFFWLEIVRCRHPSILLQILLMFCLSVMLFFSLHFDLPWIHYLNQSNGPIALAAAALIIAFAYLRYRLPAQKAAIMLLGWGAVANLAFSLWRTCCVPRMHSKEHALVVWFYGNFSHGLFFTLFALPMIFVAVRLDRIAKAETGNRSDVATAIYAIAAPALFTAVLGFVYPGQVYLHVLRADGNIYQFFLAVLMYLLVALSALVLDRRVIILSVSVALMLTGTKVLGGLTGCSLLGLALFALHRYWQSIRRALLAVVPART